jgi:photosystem II stability/assembly factor-like uncharacterized protein
MRRSLRSVAILGIMGVVAMPVTASAAPPPWHVQPSGTGVTLKGIEFTTSCRGWAVGEPGESAPTGTATPIRATRNGGKTWFGQTSGITDTTLNRVDFVDNAHGWAVGEPFETGGNSSAPGAPAILHTTNGGATWTQQTNNVSPALDPTAENDNEGLSFVSPTEGWIAVSSYGGLGNGGAILHTSDGGATYSQQVLPNNGNVADVYFVDASNGWAVNDNSEILNTTDGGTTWTVQYATSGPSLEAVAFYNVLRGVAVGDSGAIWVTKDGGTTWNPGVIAAPSGTFDNVTLTDVAFPTANRVAITTDPDFFANNHSQVLLSYDGGAVAYPQNSGTTNTLNSVAYVRGTTNGWVSGENGTIRTNHTPAC